MASNGAMPWLGLSRSSQVQCSRLESMLGAFSLFLYSSIDRPNTRSTSQCSMLATMSSLPLLLLPSSPFPLSPSPSLPLSLSPPPALLRSISLSWSLSSWSLSSTTTMPLQGVEFDLVGTAPGHFTAFSPPSDPAPVKYDHSETVMPTGKAGTISHPRPYSLCVRRSTDTASNGRGHHGQ